AGPHRRGGRRGRRRRPGGCGRRRGLNRRDAGPSTWEGGRAMTLPPDAIAALGPLGDEADAVAADLVARDAVAGTFAGDHTLWREDPTELADRLGWIPVVEEMVASLGELRDRCSRLLAAAPVEHVLVMGMGGSSLFPEVLAQTFGPHEGCPSLHVLDSTDPVAVARIDRTCPPE